MFCMILVNSSSILSASVRMQPRILKGWKIYRIKVSHTLSNCTPYLLLWLANNPNKTETSNAEALGSFHQVGTDKSHWLRKAATNTWSVLARLSLSSAMFSPMKMLGFSNRMFNSSSIQSKHFFHMSGCRGASRGFS